jgi:hypothetical protein
MPACSGLLSSSRAVAFVNYNEPLQGRLMLTGRQNEMRVMWTTRDAVRPQVKFGTASGTTSLPLNWVCVL